MIGNAQQDEFVSKMRWAVVTTLRRDGSPASSVVFYAREGDTLVFSTTMDRLKAKTLQHDPRVAVTVLDEGAPFGFVTIEGRATLHQEALVADHVMVNRAMRNDPNWNAPEGFEERLRNEGRVIVRVKAERVSGVVNRG